MKDLQDIVESEHIDWVDCDILDFVALDKAFEGISHVIHGAAVVSFHQADKALMNKVNIEGTRNVVALSQKHNVQKLLYVSSVAALGRSPGKKVIDEDSKWEDSSYNSNYANSKYQGELEVWRAQEEGLASVIINPSVIIGPGHWNSSSMQIFRFVKEGRRFYPQGDINFVDVRDVCFAIEKLLFNEIIGERFILNGGKTPYKNLFGLIAKEFKKKPPLIKVNSVLITFAYVFESIAAAITGKRSMVTRESVKLSKMDFLFANDKVRESLKMDFIPVDESVKWTCARLINK
jgi:nucleoside-diphosphate-sugar epimerase